MMNRPVAVITGASSGIGEMFARKMADRNYDLIIIARREKLLKKISREIVEKYKVNVVVIPADLSVEAETLKIAEILKRNSKIEILVNNAGFATVGRLDKLPLEKPLAMVNLHVQATTILTHTVLKAMIKNNKGFIINVSSMAGFLSAPYNVTYTATKAFLNTFSRSLQKEVRGYGIKVQALCPGFTYSGFHDTKELRKIGRRGVPKWMWISSELVVNASLSKLQSDRVIVIPSFKYKIIKFLLYNNLFLGLSGMAVKYRRRREKNIKAPHK